MFIDQAKIHVRSGKGGAGCLSFRREKFIEHGGPDGGNGGRGGDVIIVADKSLSTLQNFRFQQHFRAENGHHGMGRNRTGADGESVRIYVPLGTEILLDDKETLLADLTEHGEEVILAKGGDPGMGNAHYKSSTNRTPRRTTPGYPGEERSVWLCLKLMADVGLVGLPNAGKSTFLSSTTEAKPKIANYPFTTLSPKLGVLSYDHHHIVIADLPGLIEGAHEGVGLGHQFLGHIERCSVLLHLIGVDNEDPIHAYKTIREELRQYGHDLLQKPEIVALNKCDLIDEEAQKDLKSQLEEITKGPVFLISGATQMGLPDLVKKLLECTQGYKKETEKEEPKAFNPLDF